MTYQTPLRELTAEHFASRTSYSSTADVIPREAGRPDSRLDHRDVPLRAGSAGRRSERRSHEWNEIAPIPRIFAPEALRPLHHLNRRLLDILVDEWRRGTSVASIAVLGKQLSLLGDEVLWRLARVPLSLVDAEFRHGAAWCAVTAGNRSDYELSESPLPRARALELAALTFGLASTTAQASPESARLMFGMSPAVADAFADFTLDLVQWLGQARAHWVRPRWHDRPQDWCRLIATAEHADIARLPPVAIRAMNRLLADLEPATRVEAETRHSRR